MKMLMCLSTSPRKASLLRLIHPSAENSGFFEQALIHTLRLNIWLSFEKAFNKLRQSFPQASTKHVASYMQALIQGAMTSCMQASIQGAMTSCRNAWIGKGLPPHKALIGVWFHFKTTYVESKSGPLHASFGPKASFK